MNLIGKSAFSATREPIGHFGSTFSWAKKAAARESKSRPRPQHTVLPSQPGQLLAFFGGHPRRPTFVDLSLGNPPSQTEKPKSPAGEQQQTTTRRLLEPNPQLFGRTPPDKQQAFKYLLPKRPNRASHTITEYVSAKPGGTPRGSRDDPVRVDTTVDTKEDWTAIGVAAQSTVITTLPVGAKEAICRQSYKAHTSIQAVFGALSKGLPDKSGSRRGHSAPLPPTGEQTTERKQITISNTQPHPPSENTRPCDHTCPTHQAPPVIEPQVLNKDQVSLRVNLSPSQIYKLMKAGKFPRQIQLSPNRVGWLRTEIDTWIEDRKQKREGAQA